MSTIQEATKHSKKTIGGYFLLHSVQCNILKFFTTTHSIKNHLILHLIQLSCRQISSRHTVLRKTGKSASAAMVMK